jgi:hypothetical protein
MRSLRVTQSASRRQRSTPEFEQQTKNKLLNCYAMSRYLENLLGYRHIHDLRNSILLYSPSYKNQARRIASWSRCHEPQFGIAWTRNRFVIVSEWRSDKIHNPLRYFHIATFGFLCGISDSPPLFTWDIDILELLSTIFGVCRDMTWPAFSQYQWNFPSIFTKRQHPDTVPGSTTALVITWHQKSQQFWPFIIAFRDNTEF